MRLRAIGFVVVELIIGAGLLLASIGVVLLQRQPHRPAAAVPAPAKQSERQVITNPFSDAPMIDYDARDLAITIDRRHAPRQLLLCITDGAGEEQCDLVEGWRIGGAAAQSRHGN